MQCHVGIPRSLLERFQNKDGEFFVQDLARNKGFTTNAKGIGVKRNYYDKSTEEFLGNRFENDLGTLLKEMEKQKEMAGKVNVVQNHTGVIEDFFRYQMARSKKSLELVNKESRFAQEFGVFSHSEYVSLQSAISANPLSMLESPLCVRLVTPMNDDDVFVTNSLGFFPLFQNERGLMGYVLPVGSRLAILIASASLDHADETHLVLDSRSVFAMNQFCVLFEKVWGNGFLVCEKQGVLCLLLAQSRVAYQGVAI